MKKALIIVAILIAVPLAAIFICISLGALRLHNCPSSANEPTIKTGSYFFASLLKEPERLNFITFERSGHSMEFANGLMVFRLCGLPGDKLQMKDGVLFVNGKNADEGLDLYKEYMVKVPEEIERVRALAVETDNDADPDFPIRADFGDSLLATLSTVFVKKNKMTCGPLANLPVVEEMQQQWGRDWNTDNFGPLTVPQDSLFVLGDNRHNALDSRFTGFVARSSFKGTVLNK